MTKASARNLFSSLKCAKTHLQQSIISNIFRGLNPRTPLQQGEGKGRQGRGWKGKGGKGWGREGRAGEATARGEKVPPRYEVVAPRQLLPGYGPERERVPFKAILA